jgi:hypothetical protein
MLTISAFIGRSAAGAAFATAAWIGAAGCGGSAGPSEERRLDDALHGEKTAANLTESGPTCPGPIHVSALAPVGSANGHGTIVVPVFWGHNVASDTVANVPGFLGSFNSSGVMTMLVSEYISVQPTIAPAVTITPHYATGTQLVDADIQKELSYQAGQHVLPDVSTESYVYAVHFPPGITITTLSLDGVPTTACTPDFLHDMWCAYHLPLSANQAYLVIPDHSTGACSTNFCVQGVPSSYAAMTVAESHEVAEALTDPDVVNGFQVRALNDANCTGQEIGDVCGGQSALVSGQWVQPE